MSAPKGRLVTVVAFRSDGTVRALELSDLDELKVKVSDPLTVSIQHLLLDGNIHSDTIARAVLRGDLVTGQDVGSGVIKWKALAKGTLSQHLSIDSNGDIYWKDTPTDFITDGWHVGSGSYTYVSADAPTYTITIPDADAALINVGSRLKLTDSTVKYFIVTSIGSSSGGLTTITVYGGTDYTLSGGAITNPYWSEQKSPKGFPTQPEKWTVLVSDTSQQTQVSPTQNVWYNLGGINIVVPIGSWTLSYMVCLAMTKNPATNMNARATLSTANNSESDIDFTCYEVMIGASGSLSLARTLYREKNLTLASKTTYYINSRADNASIANLINQNNASPLILRAVCTLL